MSGPKGTGETVGDSNAEGEAEISVTPEHDEVPARTWGAVPEQTKQRSRHLTLGTQEGVNASAKCSVGKTEHYDMRPYNDPVHHVTSSKGAVGFIGGCRTEEYAALLARNRDLEALQREAVECRRRKPVKQQAEEEAVRRYMKIVCNEPLCPEAVLVPPGWVTDSPPLTLPNTRKSKTVKDGKAKKENSRIPGLRPPLGRAPMWQSRGSPNEVGAESESQTSTKVWEFTKLQNTQSLRVSDSSEILVYKEEVKKINMGLPAGLGKIPLRAATPPSTSVETSTVSSVSGVEELCMVDSQDTSLSSQHPKLTPVPLSRKETPPGMPHTKPTNPQPCIPSPKLPEFIRQFVDHDWFKELFPDLKTRHALSPKDFAQLLLKHMERVEAEIKMQILKALWGLHQQGALGISEQICTCLINVLRSSTSSATANEKHFLTKLMSTLVSLDSASQQLVVELLAFLVPGELQDTAQYLLEAMGVKEVDLWLRPEVEFWGTGLAGKLEPQDVLRKKAADWLELWTYQYKVRNRASFLQNLSVKDLFTAVDVLNYFCSQRRARQKPQPSSRPPVQTETKLVSPPKYRSQPVYRLGERLTSEQKPHTKGVILPPLLSRHSPTSFPPFISLPLPRISAGHFPFAFSYSEDRRPLMGTRQHYFFLERSFVGRHRSLPSGAWETPPRPGPLGDPLNDSDTKESISELNLLLPAFCFIYPKSV